MAGNAHLVGVSNCWFGGGTAAFPLSGKSVGGPRVFSSVFTGVDSVHSTAAQLKFLGEIVKSPGENQQNSMCSERVSLPNWRPAGDQNLSHSHR